MQTKVTGLGLAAMLVGCGGGGDGGSSPAPSTQTPYALTFTPAVLNLTAAEGTSYLVVVEAQIDRPIPEPVNVAIIDRFGVIQPSASIVPLSTTRYRATLSTQTTLSQGSRAGTFEIRICRDNPLTCASPIAGSPWQVPFSFTITPPPTPPAPPPPLPPVPPPAPPPAPPPGVGATFSPASIGLTTYQDELAPLQVVATFANTVSQIYPRFVDPSGVFQPDPATVTTPGQSTATLQISGSVAPGTHTGNLQLRLCMDLSCTAEYANSPALLPYTITVLPATNLSPLSPLAAAGDWSMFQGNAGHTGYVPVTLDSTKFNRRWKWTVPASDPATGGVVTPAASANDRVYFVVSGYFMPSTAYALNESDSSVAWRYEFGSIFSVNPPAVAGGKVFMASSGHSDTFMWSLDASNGVMLAKVPFSSQWEHYYAPTIIDGSVYTNGGSYGGLLSFKVSDGTLNWFNSGLLQIDQWTPAIDATHAYAFIGGTFFAVDRTTGATSYSITDTSWSFGSYSQFSAPVLGSVNTVIGINTRPIIGQNRLINFDTANRTIRWSVPGNFVSEPAVANGVIYVANGKQLEARRETDGTLLWSWVPSESSSQPFGNGNHPSNVIATDNLVFVSTTANTYAIDIASRSKVWSFARAGKLALSRNGVLYIAPLPGVPDVAVGVLTAINLK
ncbi:MAG: hypothetical protein H6R02_1527 [Burkholderiaceae bacterium]|jgi:hypothetical protein|nr:hypothetical protein [Burkholderiaceae bacterium]